jgi:hypothetical protein
MVFSGSVKGYWRRDIGVVMLPRTPFKFFMCVSGLWTSFLRVAEKASRDKAVGDTMFPEGYAAIEKG